MLLQSAPARSLMQEVDSMLLSGAASGGGTPTGRVLTASSFALAPRLVKRVGPGLRKCACASVRERGKMVERGRPGGHDQAECCDKAA